MVGKITVIGFKKKRKGKIMEKYGLEVRKTITIIAGVFKE